uniref:Transposase (Putative), gypsy type n=1 Tax=Tanacetum cinerariifolium TaxID=118510 RepID=A0A6L2MBR4_TANCI|nr:hypothetical protein [Tanacetum cinerariifolium]
MGRLIGTQKDMEFTIRALANNPYINNIWQVVDRLIVAATVYFLCQERNFRMFKNESTADEVYKIIVNNVKDKLMSLRMKKSKAVLTVAANWAEMEMVGPLLLWMMPYLDASSWYAVRGYNVECTILLPLKRKCSPPTRVSIILNMMKPTMDVSLDELLDTIQLETTVSTISQEYLLELTSEYGISEDVHPELPGPKERIVGFSEDMDIFNLISSPNPSKVKTGLCPRATHEVPLLTATVSQVIDMEDPDAAKESFRTPFAIEKSPLDFDNENPSSPITECKGTKDQAHEIVAPEIPLPRNMPAIGATADANAPPKGLRKDYASVRPEQRTREGKSLPMMGLAVGSTFVTPTDTKGMFDPDSLSYAEPQPPPEQSMTQMHVFRDSDQKCGYHESARTRSEKSTGLGKSTSSPSMVGSPRDIYQPGWGMTNNCRLDTPDACQYVVDHIVPSGYFSELRHMPNTEILCQYNKNLAQQVAMGSQLRLRFKQEVRLLKKARAQITRRDQMIQVREEKIKKLDQEIQDDKVEKHCSEMDARLDALSIDFFKELYPHMLTVIAGRRWAIGRGLRLAVMKCTKSIELRQTFAGIAKGMSEGLAHGIEHGKAGLGLEVVEAYDPEANNKYLQALHELKDLNYPIVDQLESLKDAPMEAIMASLHLESDSEEDAPKWICDLRPSTSQLKIYVYPEVRDLRDPWAVKEEMLLEEAIADNVSRVEKKKRCWVVCRTNEIGSAHHARSDGVPVSVPTVTPQGLAILQADAATQTELSEDDASLRLFRSKSLPLMYNLNWP